LEWGLEVEGHGWLNSCRSEQRNEERKYYHTPKV